MYILEIEGDEDLILARLFLTTSTGSTSENGVVSAYFNRFGGAPTVSHTAASGFYVLTFPGLEGKLFNGEVIHIATRFGGPGEIFTSSASGNPFIETLSSAGAPTDGSFYYVVYGTNLAP